MDGKPILATILEKFQHFDTLIATAKRVEDERIRQDTTLSRLEDRLQAVEDGRNNSSSAGLTGWNCISGETFANCMGKVLAWLPQKLVRYNCLAEVLHQLVREKRQRAHYT